MEVRSARPPANRAVAALQSASSAPTSASPLLTNAHPRRSGAPITRYNSFEALCQATQTVDENAELREELRRKLPQPIPRNDVAALGSQVTVRILELLDPLGADAAAFAATCRAVRESLLRASNVEKTVMVPNMVSAAAFASEVVRSALYTFFVARGGEVSSLVMRRADEATAREERGEASFLDASPLRLPVSWALQLVSHMPYLTELDLRHVQWGESHASQVLPHFFSDLHLVISGTLRILKVDAALMQYWKPGWWRRHVNLRTLTVGCRYSFAPSSDNGASSATQLALPPDYFTLMREENRHWKLELWCPLKPNSIQQLFSPPAGVSFASVEELLVNVRYSEHVCEGGEHRGGRAASTVAGNAEAIAAAEAPASAKPSASGRKSPATGDAPEAVVAYPRLNTVMIVDIGDRPEGAAEAYQVMMLLAPELKHFNVCDTVVIGAAAAASATEGGKGERVKRGGGTANHVK
ncbi:hypothetical protein ABB37_01492 [Leptomonas pyrrhocoris]|uniref:Uncharacterized protein n=1 Tax=Leptomonas pyrrhocoris TaxID=157538 RepID=A0A0N0VHH4_LEPPY|nr:hypothetical protein ABB37_01492 [Leptomonas pyrrhocoris]KPA85084.1 hypothetical protein ABB37_01492 [Leptomonas pyrrhocoris]|eukprot:XP_015663523.1 hypothetical protein ABB37_01492 [Leptomonas pyrrhocoris]